MAVSKRWGGIIFAYLTCNKLSFFYSFRGFLKGDYRTNDCCFYLSFPLSKKLKYHYDICNIILRGGDFFFGKKFALMTSSWTLLLTFSVKGCRFLLIIIKGFDISFISEILAKCGDWHDIRWLDLLEFANTSAYFLAPYCWPWFSNMPYTFMMG